jgi:uncharacterized protein
MLQDWREVTLLHWPVDPASVAELLPEGTVPDTLDGVSYVGLVLFRMDGVRLPREPGLPYLRSFCETNVRLYSVDEAGHRGVIFRSLDAARLIPVFVGRFGAQLPYVWSKMRLWRTGSVIAYESRRRWPGRRRVSAQAVVSVAEHIRRPSALELFLTARWGPHLRWGKRTVYLPNEHEEWPLHRARLVELEESLVAAAGVPRPDAAPVSVLHSPGVSVRFGTPVVLD